MKELFEFKNKMDKKKTQLSQDLRIHFKAPKGDYAQIKFYLWARKAVK